MYCLIPVSDNLPARNAAWRAVMVLLLLGLFSARSAFAVSPPPDGGYRNGNTAEGQDALLKLTIGIDNTAIGFDALVSNTRGNDNTALGFDALFSNTIGEKNTAVG